MWWRQSGLSLSPGRVSSLAGILVPAGSRLLALTAGPAGAAPPGPDSGVASGLEVVAGGPVREGDAECAGCGVGGAEVDAEQYSGVDHVRAQRRGAVIVPGRARYRGGDQVQVEVLRPDHVFERPGRRRDNRVVAADVVRIVGVGEQ